MTDVGKHLPLFVKLQENTLRQETSAAILSERWQLESWRSSPWKILGSCVHWRRQQMAGHESARTTGLYDRRDDTMAMRLRELRIEAARPEAKLRKRTRGDST